MSPFRTLPLDRGAERSVAALRLLAAAAVAGAAIWLMFLQPSPMVWGCVGLSLLASVAWLAMASSARRRLRHAERYRLVLDPQGLALFEGDRERRVEWDAVESIETDEDRLVVSVRVRGEEEALVVEPRYGGLGVFDLEAAIRAAKEQASQAPAD